MKSKLAEFLIGAFLAGFIPFCCVANDKHAQNVATVVAIPTAVPVAPYAPYTYVASNLQTAYVPPPMSAYDKLIEDIAQRVAVINASKQPTFAAAIQKTMFGTKCAGCHKVADENLGRPQLILEQLTCEQRVAAIAAIVNDQMPKGGKLNPQEASQLIKELSTKPKVTADIPPPPPEVP